MATPVRTDGQGLERRLPPWEPPPGDDEDAEAVGPSRPVERFRAWVDQVERLYGEALEERDRAVREARVYEDAWMRSVARRDALSRALVRLLRATKRFGYRPREFAARCRAQAVLTGSDPFDMNRGPADIELNESPQR